jgi:hypothetical protein
MPGLKPSQIRKLFRLILPKNTFPQNVLSCILGKHLSANCFELYSLENTSTQIVWNRILWKTPLRKLF